MKYEAPKLNLILADWTPVVSNSQNTATLNGEPQQQSDQSILQGGDPVAPLP